MGKLNGLQKLWKNWFEFNFSPLISFGIWKCKNFCIIYRALLENISQLIIALHSTINCLNMVFFYKFSVLKLNELLKRIAQKILLALFDRI